MWGGGGGGVVTQLLFCLGFIVFRFTRHGADNNDLILLIIVTLILVAFTVYVLSASSKFHQLIIIKFPIPQITSDEHLYM